MTALQLKPADQHTPKSVNCPNEPSGKNRQIGGCSEGLKLQKEKRPEHPA
jgi:hypothetical protein